MRKYLVVATTMALLLSASQANAATISGKVTDASGKAMEGVTVSAFDADHDVSVSVFSQADGTYRIDGLRDAEHNVRARLLGQLDAWEEEIESGETGVDFEMEVATGEDLEAQRTANSAFSMMKWDDHKDKTNFKMMCMYCHQVGTVGWRTPEEPVDWETMIRRMDGYGGLYKHSQETIVERIVSTYSDEAVAKWPAFEPPPAPTGLATKARITEWDMGEQRKAMIHDLEPGKDGLVYAVDMLQNSVVSLDPMTGARETYTFPGKVRGPHSIEMSNDGNMWFTLALSGEMAKFDVKTKEFTIASSAESPAPRGAYPHTLRINPADPEQLVWYTDAGTNSAFAIHPETLKVKEYKLLSANQVQAAGGRGESRGITPYGIDYSPTDGAIWASKLNGNRIVRIDPKTGEVKEWEPPFLGPRRHHVGPDGLVWVPGFGSGQFASFDYKSEEWKVYDLPDKDNQIPYALNIDKKGFVWICGTGSDVIWRFDPKTEDMVEFRMPSRVTYSREIEFDAEGNVWTCNSNYPGRHIERQKGSIIKLEILDQSPAVARN